MKKSLTTRVLGLTVLYCVVFFILVMLQFSYEGNFTLSAGAMTIRGRYLQAPSYAPLYASEGEESGWRQIAGGIKIFYGGLEIDLMEENANGMTQIGEDGTFSPISPDYMLIGDNRVRFGLPGGTTLSFSSIESSRGSELQISAQFADDISEVTIPLIYRRAAMIYENEQPGILYNGSRYFFGNSSQELENERLVLSRDSFLISYRTRSDEVMVFDPANFITARSRDYENALSSWQDSSYAYWNQNAQNLQNENDIIAFLGEALRRNQFPAALSSIPRNFASSSNHTYRSSGFVGGMAVAYRTFTAAERDRLNRITSLIRDRSPDIFAEENTLDYLFTRGNTSLANELLEFIRSVEPETIQIDHCPALLEMNSSLRRWMSAEVNTIEQFSERIISLISENIHYVSENDSVFVSYNDGSGSVSSPEFDLRLGKALLAWAVNTEDSEWAAVGRSLILSALTGGGVGAGNLYTSLNPGNYYPRAEWLANDGLWAWTVTPTARASYNAQGNLTISTSFPVNLSHYVIVQGVRPFIKIQIHDRDWRTDSQFERYDSSGWVYYQQDQILILKLSHRATVENVVVFYTD